MITAFSYLPASVESSGSGANEGEVCLARFQGCLKNFILCMHIVYRHK